MRLMPSQHDTAASTIQVIDIFALLRFAVIRSRTDKTDERPDTDSLVVAAASKKVSRRIEANNIDFVVVTFDPLHWRRSTQLQNCEDVSQEIMEVSREPTMDLVITGAGGERFIVAPIDVENVFCARVSMTCVVPSMRAAAHRYEASIAASRGRC